MLTPDDRRLVFLASPESQGHTDHQRLNDPWSVYVLDLPDGKPRRLAGGFDERGAAMSPDGKRVAVTGRRGSEQGLWLVELDTGEVRKVSDAYLAVPVFSPDGRKLVVAFTPKENHNQLSMLDVPASWSSRRRCCVERSVSVLIRGSYLGSEARHAGPRPPSSASRSYSVTSSSVRGVEFRVFPWHILGLRTYLTFAVSLVGSWCLWRVV